MLLDQMIFMLEIIHELQKKKKKNYYTIGFLSTYRWLTSISIHMAKELK